MSPSDGSDLSVHAARNTGPATAAHMSATTFVARVGFFKGVLPFLGGARRPGVDQTVAEVGVGAGGVAGFLRLVGHRNAVMTMTR